MSHFIGLCFGEAYDDNLEQYWEGLEVEPYIRYTKDEAIDKIKQERAKAYEHAVVQLENNKKLDAWFQAHYQKIIERGLFISYEDAWEEAKTWGYEIDEDENLLSTYNPDSKWDWFEIGGRWSGYLPLAEFDEKGNYQYTDQATVGEVDWDQYRLENKAPFCFVTECGGWFEKGEMGWWASVSDEKETDEWSSEFWNYINSLPEDTLVTAIDFHI